MVVLSCLTENIQILGLGVSCRPEAATLTSVATLYIAKPQFTVWFFMIEWNRTLLIHIQMICTLIGQRLQGRCTYLCKFDKFMSFLLSRVNDWHVGVA